MEERESVTERFSRGSGGGDDEPFGIAVGGGGSVVCVEGRFLFCVPPLLSCICEKNVSLLFIQKNP